MSNASEEANDHGSEEKDQTKKEDSTENAADASPDDTATSTATSSSSSSSSLFPSFHCAICDRSFASAKQLAIHNRSTQCLYAVFLTPRHKRRALKADASHTEKKEKTVKKESKYSLPHCPSLPDRRKSRKSSKKKSPRFLELQKPSFFMDPPNGQGSTSTTLSCRSSRRSSAPNPRLSRKKPSRRRSAGKMCSARHPRAAAKHSLSVFR